MGSRRSENSRKMENKCNPILSYIPIFIVSYFFLQLFVTYLKCTFNTPTVTHIDRVTKIIVNRRYFPNNGTAKDVGGIISASSKKNTVSDKRIDMQSVT